MRLLAACVALAALTLLVPASPGYDSWAYLQWGREIWDLALATAEGPAWKPLPVAVTAVLAPFGDLAPDLWLVVARTGALLAVALAFVVVRRWTQSTAAAVAAALGVLLTGGFLRHAAIGDAEPLLVGLVLAAACREQAGRPRQALALGVAAALVRVETWPFLAAYVLWRHRRAAPWIGAGLAAAWFVPEVLSSGEVLRSAGRARVPNPGQPATADVPALQTLVNAAQVTLVPLAVAALADARARRLALPGLAWILLVAAMSQAGFSGEDRYLLPGAALLAVAGAAGLAHAPRPAVALLAALSVPFAVARARDAADLPARLAHQAGLREDLRALIRVAGRDRIVACGRPAVGRYRGTLLAYALDVPKARVRADGAPDEITFVSRLTPSAAPSPPRAGRLTGTEGRWRLYSRGSSCLSD